MDCSRWREDRTVLGDFGLKRLRSIERHLKRSLGRGDNKDWLLIIQNEIKTGIDSSGGYMVKQKKIRPRSGVALDSPAQCDER